MKSAIWMVCEFGLWGGFLVGGLRLYQGQPRTILEAGELVELWVGTLTRRMVGALCLYQSQPRTVSATP